MTHPASEHIQTTGDGENGYPLPPAFFPEPASLERTEHGDDEEQKQVAASHHHDVERVEGHRYRGHCLLGAVEIAVAEIAVIFLEFGACFLHSRMVALGHCGVECSQ